MRSVLVTGGAGFIGSHLIEELLKVDGVRKVHSVDNYFCGTTENHVPDTRVSYEARDTRALAMSPALAHMEVDTVFHLGEYARIVSSFDDVRLCHEYNQQGTFEVLEFCRARGAKLVYAASSSKFGNDGGDQHLSPYAWMKAKNCELIRNYGEWFGLGYAIAYFFNVYGPRQRSIGGYATVIGIFEECVLGGRPLPVVSPGTQRRVFTHVSDIARGLATAGARGSGDGYMLGANEDHSILEVATMFGWPHEIVPERRGERLASVMPPSRAPELGWSPTVKLPEYVEGWLARARRRPPAR